MHTNCIVRRSEVSRMQRTCMGVLSMKIFNNINIFKFFRNVSREMSKVTWPKARELRSYTVIVIVTVLFVALFFAAVDFGISEMLSTFFE